MELKAQMWGHLCRDASLDLKVGEAVPGAGSPGEEESWVGFVLRLQSVQQQGLVNAARIATWD